MLHRMGQDVFSMILQKEKYFFYKDFHFNVYSFKKFKFHLLIEHELSTEII